MIDIVIRTSAKQRWKDSFRSLTGDDTTPYSASMLVEPVVKLIIEDLGKLSLEGLAVQ